MLKNKALWFTLTLLTAYLSLGYLAGPGLVQPRLENYVSSHLGRELRFEQLRINPLTWSAQLDTVELAENEQSLWPGLAISAARLDLRFSFWRLSPVVSALTLQKPLLVLDDTNAQLQTDRYPFVGLWQQWQEGLNPDDGQAPVAIKRWHVEAGQVLVRNPGSAVAGRILLDNISLQAAPQDPNGVREFSLALSVADKAIISAQGLFRSADLEATGQYQLTVAAAADGRMAELQAEGAFSSDILTDALRIDLSDSQLHSNRVATCLLDGLVCAAITPLDADFDSSLLAASDGVRVLEATARLNAFDLNASLAQGRLSFADQQDFARAQIALRLLPAVLPASANGIEAADQETGRSFVLQLHEADNDQYQIEGHLDLLSHATDARFDVNGRHPASGTAQLRRMDHQQERPAHSRLDLQLENPAASLAQAFLEDNFSAELTSRTLQLQLAASLDELGLRLQETIILEQTTLLQNATADSASDSAADSDARLDAERLIALLQDPDERIELQLPQLTVETSTGTSLGDVIRGQSLSALTELAEQPFASLARAFNISNQNLNAIRFAPGSAALDAESTETLADLAGILSQRPALGIIVAGVYDPLIDRKALQTEQLRTHIALAMAADLAFRTGAEPPDFSDPIVHSVIDEFARRRLPPDVMQQFVNQYGHADADQGVLPEGDVIDYYSSLFDVLVDYAEIPQSAMTSLARYRAQAVLDGLEDAGVQRERLEPAGQAATSSESGAGDVPLPMQLKVLPDDNMDSSIGSTGH